MRNKQYNRDKFLVSIGIPSTIFYVNVNIFFSVLPYLTIGLVLVCVCDATFLSIFVFRNFDSETLSRLNDNEIETLQAHRNWAPICCRFSFLCVYGFGVHLIVTAQLGVTKCK